MSSNIEDIPFIDDLLDHIKSVEGKNYGAYNPELYTEEDKKDEVSLRDAVRRNTLFYKNIKNPDSKANQQIHTLASISRPLTRMVALDAHLRGNTNALSTLQSFLGVDVDWDIGPKTIAAATEYVKSDPTLQEFFDHQRATYRDNPDTAFKEVYNDADQREFLAINRNISHKNRKLFDLHSQVLRSQNNFKPFMENGTTTTVRISGVQNKEDGLHYNVPTYDPYNQKIIDPTTPEGYKELDTLIKTFGGWDQFPSFENPMEGDLAAKRLKKYINADAMYYKNTGKKEGGFINMQEGSLVLDQPTVTTTPTPRPIQVTTSDPNDPNIGLPEGPDPAGFVPYPTTQTPEGYVNPREKFPFSGFGSGSGKYTRTNYLTAPSTESSQSSDSQATNQLITNVQNAIIIDRSNEIDAEQLETDLNLNLSQGIQTYDSNDIITDADYASFVDNFGQDEADRLGIQAGQSWTHNLETSEFFKQSYEVDYDSFTGERKITRKFTSTDGQGGPSQFLVGVDKQGNFSTNQDTFHWTYEDITTLGKNITYKDVYGNTYSKINDNFKANNQLMWQTDSGIFSSSIVTKGDPVINAKGELTYGSSHGEGEWVYRDKNTGKITKYKDAPRDDMTVYDVAKGINPDIDALGSGEDKKLNWGQRISKDIKDWWNSDVDVKLIGLKNPDGTPMEGSFKVGDLVQDVAFGAVLGLLTGDEGDALVGAGGQVASSYVNEMVTGIKTAANSGTIDWTPDQIEHFEAGMHSLVAMGVLALQGGSAEDVAMVGAQSYATIYGAEKLGELMGLQGKAAYGPNLPGGSPAEVIGGGTISALFTAIQGGNLRDATYSFASGAAWAYMPVLGAFVTAAQYLAGDLLYPEMSNDAGYTNLNFSDMQTTSFSQGDYDPKKSAPEFVEFTELFMQPVYEAAQDLMEEYGITFEGDFQVEFGRTDGLQIAFWDKDITGFLDRGGYDQETGDIDSRLDPRRRFESTPEGIARAQEYIIGLLTWGAKNGVTKVTEIAAALEKAGRANTIEALQPAVSEYGITADDNLLDTIFSVGARQGGKISLDKGGNVQYNKGNYGLVNEKGKAPPSARADDVPMNLTEGDFVLSQPAVALYGEDTINRMLTRAATDAGTNLKSGGKVPVNVHNGEYIIPKKLTEYIGPNVLETMNNRGLMSVGERPNT